VVTAQNRHERNPHTTAVCAPVSSRLSIVRTATPIRSRDGLGEPSNVGTSPTMMVGVSPRTKPVTIGFDRNSTSHEIRDTPAATSVIPGRNSARRPLHRLSRRSLPGKRDADRALGVDRRRDSQPERPLLTSARTDDGLIS